MAAVRDAEPHNGYLQYRLAHVLAEAGRVQDAVAMLGSAVANGFLSAQLLHQERALALARLDRAPGLDGVLAELDGRVWDCQRMYAADLPAAGPGAGDLWDGERG